MTQIDLTGEEVESKAVLQRNSETVERGFWPKLRRLAGRIPFADDLATAYYCAVDPATPTRVRGVLLAALAYFVMPADLIPDFIAAL
ncbi:MAG: YkvA family protein, partial [Pseudomonadota bacterium]